MEWLNYHHLLYFWTVAREGSIVRACEKLQLSQPAISGQLRTLEKSLGAKLFQRIGRNLVLTETGQLVYRYATDIFSTGQELLGMLKGRSLDRPQPLVIGVTDALPKLIVYRLIHPALERAPTLPVVCHEGRHSDLLAQLALHELDVVLSDIPATPTVRIRAFNHLLGECGVSFLATADLAAKYRRGFPASLDGAPLLLLTENTASRRSLDQWFDTQGIRPRIGGEFADTALLEAFGQAGRGVFAAPTAIEAEVRRQYGVQLVGRVESLRERFYAISVERKLKHPAVVAISEAARQKLFG